jgi:hypothetical protein
MRAAVGDRLIVHGTRVDDVVRDAEVVGVRGLDTVIQHSGLQQHQRGR